MSDTIIYQGKHRVFSGENVTCLGHQLDANAEEKLFQVSRYLEGFDLSVFSAALLLSGEDYADRQPLTAETVTDETVTYRWSVGAEVTASGRPVVFQPVFEKDSVVLHLDKDIFTVASSVDLNAEVERCYPNYVEALEEKADRSELGNYYDKDEIDASLQEMSAAVEATGNRGSHPNLLVNPNGAVWQRGSSFTLTRNGTNWQYADDRWRYKLTGPAGASATITPGTNGGTLITITGSGTVTRQQVLEHAVQGTLSRKAGGAVVSAPFNGTVVEQVFTATTLVEWTKLEVGETASLFSPRLPGEEWALCQRYYQQISPQYLPCSYYRGALLYYNLTFPQMRAAPVVTFSSDITMFKGGSTQAPEYTEMATNNNSTGYEIVIKVTMRSNPTGIDYILHSGLITLDAEIYD